MRGGTSKGAFFLASDLPADPAERDDLLLRIMGSPDPAQIDGLGGAQAVTSKVAVVSRSAEPDCDVDYLFLQVGVDAPTVSDRQTCGNLLAAVGQFAVERGLVAAEAERTGVRIRMVNTGGRAESTFATPGGRVDYAGDTAVAGVPGTAAPVALAFAGTEGSVCGSLLPTGRLVDEIDGLEVTCIDNGMPVVVAREEDLPPARIRALRIEAGKAMGLGDVTGSAVPKITFVSAPQEGGAIRTRTFNAFDPVRQHPSIGVFGAVSVVTAALLDGAVGHELLVRPAARRPYSVEHPSGSLDVDVDVEPGDPPKVRRSAVIRTARPLFDGTTFPRP
jgi:4-oxalomesaconate tautomerase